MAAAGFTTDANGVIRDATGAIIGADPSAINTNAFTPVAAQTSSASGTDALTAGLLKGVSNVLANPATGTALANAAEFQESPPASPDSRHKRPKPASSVTRTRSDAKPNIATMA